MGSARWAFLLGAAVVVVFGCAKKSPTLTEAINVKADQLKVPCSACSFTELYGKDVSELERLARHPNGGVRVHQASDNPPYR